MLKKTIKYVDYNDVEREEDFYFNFSKAELIRMQNTTEGGLKEKLEKIIKEKNVVEIYREFEKIIFDSYGKRSEDGRRFIKSEEISNEFKQTEAYSVLLMEMIENPGYAAEFINSLLPADLRSADASKSNRS